MVVYKGWYFDRVYAKVYYSDIILVHIQ